MKKVFTVVAGALVASLGAQQSFRLENFSSKEHITDGSSIYVSVQAAKTHSLFADVINTSSAEQTYSVKRWDLQLNDNGAETASALFCFGELCYTSGVMEAFAPVTLEAGQRTSNLPQSPGVPQMLIAELSEVSPEGISLIKYKIFNINDTLDAISWTIRYNDPTAGLANASVARYSLSLAPNPAHGSTSAVVNLHVPGKCAISIFDVLGAKVSTSDKFLPAGESTVPLDLRTLKAGVYFVSLVSETGSTVRRLVID